MSGSFEPVDLTNCDREPIHQLGSVQPFGFLLAISSDWIVTRASANLAEFLAITQADALGRPVTSLITPESLHTIRNKLTTLRGSDVVERIFGIALTSAQERFDLAVHMSDSGVIIEGEHCQEDRHDAPSLSMRSMMSRLDHTETMEAFFRDGARQARALTGFDRVMVYRFDDSGSGEVVAEAARAGIGSFLGLHYPASDIPVQRGHSICATCSASLPMSTPLRSRSSRNSTRTDSHSISPCRCCVRSRRSTSNI